MQLITTQFDGIIQAMTERVYEQTTVKLDTSAALFKDLSSEETVYLSKGVEFNINDAFTIYGTDRLKHPVEIMHKEKLIFGLNFYPEKQETTNGLKILETFALDICGCAGSWTIDSFIESEIAEIKSIVGDKKVLCGLSGG